jgi:putative membrane-bound dehydrogenase-like protein
MRFLTGYFSAALLCCLAGAQVHAEPLAAETYRVGVARVDITPDYPVRLSGFGFRRTESEGVTQPIFAKALAISQAQGDPVVLLTVDNLGVPAKVTAEVASRLSEEFGLEQKRLFISASHTHTAPMLSGVCPTLFSLPIPPDHQKRIDRYTKEFTDKLVEVAAAALADRRPARLTWGVGTIKFAKNRRPGGGPVDHDLPLLAVRDLDGKLRALLVSYACHCVTLSNNKISGDWAGYAQEAIERAFQGAIAMTAIGCGADQNPTSGVTGDKTEVAAEQGAQIAAEVKRLLSGYLAPISGEIAAASKPLELPLAELPTKEQWEEKAKRNDAVGYYARVNLDRLARGEALKTKIDYRVASISFGDGLAMVFLPGEVVVDYSLRLKRDLDGRRLWINAYSNDAPCYIPSERVLQEGGYEGGDAMVYYDVPVRFAPGLEEKIVGAVKECVDENFKAPIDPQRTQGSLPPSPQQSRAALRTKPNLQVDLVAAEPLVVDPVAIDFGPDARLYVAEMHDYPAGLRGDFQPGGQVRILEDENGDGIFDRADVFLSGIPFPTGVTVWRKGLLVCAAPDILYAEDTDGDRKADVVQKLFSGFGTGNYQARVNSLCYGLDGWVYGSCGLFGGTITPFAGPSVALGDRDFRMNPDTGAFEPATGRTQQGRARDDFGNWFGCDNTNLCRHYPLADHYLRRNPHVAVRDTAVYVPEYPDSNRLYPATEALQLFKLSGPAGRATAACGLGVYRDDLLGAEYQGDVFVCEPVNLVVHRLKLSPRASTFSGRRVEGEGQSEFLASTDLWFRPVQVRTGPDGCLWVVDMCRHVIEHPRWIPPEDLARIDARAGDRLGRIYRIRPADKSPRPIARLDKMNARELAAALDSQNGAQRDLAAQMLRWRIGKQGDGHPEWPGAIELFRDLLDKRKRPETTVQALFVLEGIRGFDDWGVRNARRALKHPHPGVRRLAVRLSEDLPLDDELFALVDDPDAQVRLQLACSLGEQANARSAEALATLALRYPDDPHLASAVLSSVNAQNVRPILNRVLAEPSPPERLIGQLAATAAGLGERKSLAQALSQVAQPRNGKYELWQTAALARILDALDRNRTSLAEIAAAKTAADVQKMIAAARVLAADEKAAKAPRIAALSLLCREKELLAADIDLLAELLGPKTSAELQPAALAALARTSDPRVAAAICDSWPRLTPAVQNQSLDLLQSRPAWLDELLGRLERREIPPAQINAAQIDASRRQRLLSHADEKVRARAAKIFAGAGNPDRKKVLDEHRDVLSLAGDKARGKEVFARRCAACHRLEGAGHPVGPDLAAQANKSPLFLLQEILDPNRNLDSRYVQYALLTDDGLSLAGILAGETATGITLRSQDGVSRDLLRSQIDQLASTGKSLMPEGLERDLSDQDLADVIAYLTEARLPARRFPGNTPALVKAKDGVLELLATNCEIYGGQIAFEGQFKNVGLWHDVNDHVIWTVEVERAGQYDVSLDYACSDESAGNTFILEGGAAPLRGKVSGTGGWDKYRQEKIGTLNLAAGRTRIILRPDGDQFQRALMDLRGVAFVPHGRAATQE